MPPSSGELWGHHLMPSQIDVDCLLPTGIIICMRCTRDSALQTIKSDLWKKAKTYPLFHLLSDPSSYIFVSITQDAEREEFYDETRRLCDLRLFQPILKLVEPKGNREEKMLNYEIGIALGMPVNEFNEIKDLEVMTFRRNILSTCKQAIGDRESRGPLAQALYVFPPDVHSSKDLPPQIHQRLYKDGLPEEHKGKIICCIWVVSSSRNREKYSIKVSAFSTPEEVIAEVIRKRTLRMNMTPEEQKQCVMEYQSSYVLKVCGYDQFLLEHYPISQYKYVRQCVCNQDHPQLMLMAKEGVLSSLPKNIFTLPPYVMKGISALQDIDNQSTISLWQIDEMLQVRIHCATYVNVRDKGEIYVKTGVYHGTEALCTNCDSKRVESSNPKWAEWLEYDLAIQDVPRSARLCVSLCSISRKQKRKVHYAIAWGNINLFDFNNRLQADKVSLHLWPMPQGLDELLNPIGMPGSNPNKDSPCLELEFTRRPQPVAFPSHDDILQHGRNIISQGNLNTPSSRGSSISPTFSSSPINTHLDRELLLDVVRRDPLSEVSEQEKEMLWRMRYECLMIPDSLPKLLAAVKWYSKDEVSQMYVLLEEWPTTSPETSLELMDCTYTDLRVRQFAVKCLEEKLTDDQLSMYLLQLVQVLKFEPYLDNPLTDFLLRQSLLSQRIGHFFFWHLKSELHQVSTRLRFGLILEAYCRSCGAYLKSLCRQVEALEKLTKLTDSLKTERDDVQLKFLYNQVRQTDYLEALQNFPSPLNNSHVLGDLVVDQCDVKASKKRPLELTWLNPDPMAECHFTDFKILFKNGDDLRQDMLTLQVIRIMDMIWQSEGLNLRMTPYGCLATGLNVGMIEMVRNSRTVFQIMNQDLRAAIGVRSKELHRWIREKNKNEMYDKAIDAFTKSCAGYCVATFVLGIGDRHPSNIMVTERGQVFHIDFGHFLDHRKKKFGINRERVPFVLTEDFIKVIAKGSDNPTKSKQFHNFMELCGKAYINLHKHANTFITLFLMMLSCGIPELQSSDDIGYLRKTLAVEKTEQQALDYFQQQLNEAHDGAWTTKLDWFFHWVKHRN